MNWINKVSKLLTSSGFFIFSLFAAFLYTFIVSMWINNKSPILLGTIPLDTLSSFTNLMFIAVIVLSFITLVCLRIAWEYLYKIMSQCYQTQTTIKLFSLYCTTVFLIVTFFHFNAMFDYKDEYFKEIHLMKIYSDRSAQNLRDKYTSFDNFSKSYEINNDEYLTFKSKLSRILFDLKLSMMLLLFSIVSYFFVLLTKSEYKGLLKEKFFIEWYLSESHGWIKGTRDLSNEKLTVLKPDDCVKIINIEFDESKEFYTHEQSDLFQHIIAMQNDSGLFKESLDYTYDIIKSCKVTYLHYDVNKVNRCNTKYGELPKILLIAKGARLF